jgi:hypothetical protein
MRLPEGERKGTVRSSHEQAVDLSDRSILMRRRARARALRAARRPSTDRPCWCSTPRCCATSTAACAMPCPASTLYYALKAHPNEHIVRCLDRLGAGFDVASAGEMDMLLDLQVSGRRTIHTHPVKKDREIRDALRFGATTFVVDNLDELQKLLPYRGRVGVLLRVSFRASGARVDLSRKFGCSEDEVGPIDARRCRARPAHVRGLSFHVGSQVPSAAKHVEAIQPLPRPHAAPERRAARPALHPGHRRRLSGGLPPRRASTSGPSAARFRRRAGRPATGLASAGRAGTLPRSPPPSTASPRSRAALPAAACAGTTSMTAPMARTAVRSSTTRSIRCRCFRDGDHGAQHDRGPHLRQHRHAGRERSSCRNCWKSAIC